MESAPLRAWLMGVSMFRVLIAFLGLTTAIALAGSPQFREAAIAQLRSISGPFFEHGVVAEPRFDLFHADMFESMSPQERVEPALELAINRRIGAAEYVMQNTQSWPGQFASTPKLRTLINTSADSYGMVNDQATWRPHLEAAGSL